MSTDFNEVFGKLNISPEERELFNGAKVSRVVLSDARTRLNIYIEGSAEIPRSALRAAEEQIRLRIFGKKNIGVHIISSLKAEAGSSEIIYGSDFSGQALSLSDLREDTGECIVRGMAFETDTITTKKGKFIITFNITDHTDSVGVRIFADEETKNRLSRVLADGMRLEVAARAEPPGKYLDEISLGHVRGIRKLPDTDEGRLDLHPGQKRVELNLHTQMSEMDGTGAVADYIALAKKWGWKAIAITDNDSAQGFPEAFKALSGDRSLKLIYGVTGHLVDDSPDAVIKARGQRLDSEAVVFDIETTGFSIKKDAIIEIGAVKVQRGRITERFSAFVDPLRPIPSRIRELTGISDEDVRGQGTIEDVLPRFLDFVGDAFVVGHNARFDTGFIRENAMRLSLDFDPTTVDTLGLSHMLLKGLYRNRLDNIAKELNITLEKHHRAVSDAQATAEIFIKFCTMLSGMGIEDLDRLCEADEMDITSVRKLHAAPFTLLAKNDLGRTNLYRLISAAHIDYYYNVPRMPKSVVNSLRDGLLIGSGNEEGDFFDKVARGVCDEELLSDAAFYDYLEIMPPDTLSYLIADDSSPIESMEDIYEAERRIADIAKRAGIMAAASGNVHFAEPEDKDFRKIIQYFTHAVKKRRFDEERYDAALFLRTTDEMLSAFSFLGEEEARTVVITNPSLIADMIENIAPVRPDKCPPVIADSDEELRSTCLDNAHALYGDQLPEIVSERLEKELNSIIQNGYSVMYISAKKIVEDSMAHGYLVGSRGSVGSSLAATMAGISEINPLPPHYRCAQCRYSDFGSELVALYSQRTGYDLPDRNCPVCGAPLIKDGFNIPFETFLGFHGDKEPDIDLNVAGEYQARAHAFTEELFGEGQTYKAGTIGTIKDKTAIGCVFRYYEEFLGTDRPRRAETDRLVRGLVNVKRTTGQHPGGIIVLPEGEEIYSFTPVQYPANKAANLATTHFDFHSIDSNLLKLDILGKDDPSMVRELYELTGLNPMDVPIGTKEVMDLFTGLKSLGLSPEDIGGTLLGTMGIPEFNTDFAIQMLIDAGPRYVSDLVRITGLAHGTDVWLGNAEKLIKEGVCTIDTAICTRDDIMIYLIGMGLSPEMSFDIMETVRRGRLLKNKHYDEYVLAMRNAGVPEWYISSLEHIKYLFPKAHAAAYVVMLWRIAYYKVHYPREFYAAYFSIKGRGFDYESMCLSLASLRQNMKKLKNKMEGEHLATDDERLRLREMRLAEEMMARGLEFSPIDIYKARAMRFTVTEDGRIMPSLDSIEGLGSKAAESIEQAAAQGRFISIEDFISRTGVSRTSAAKLKELGILKGMPEESQLSIFDF